MSKYTEIEVLGKAAREFLEVARNAVNLDDPLSAKAQETATRCVDEAGILLLSVSEDREAREMAGRKTRDDFLHEFRAKIDEALGLTDDAEGSG